jgi:hypothetical protein
LRGSTARLDDKNGNNTEMKTKDKPEDF